MNPCYCHGDIPPNQPRIGMGPISGLQGVAHELMRHLGAEPTDHRTVAAELEQAIAKQALDTGRDILASHGLLPDLTQATTHDQNPPAPLANEHQAGR